MSEETGKTEIGLWSLLLGLKRRDNTKRFNRFNEFTYLKRIIFKLKFKIDTVLLSEFLNFFECQPSQPDIILIVALIVTIVNLLLALEVSKLL